jgi:hypothetical protein
LAIKQNTAVKNKVAKKEIIMAPRYLPKINSNRRIGLEIRFNKDLLSSSSWIDPQLANKPKVKLPKRMVEKQVSVASLSSSPKAKRELSGANQIRRPKKTSRI